MKPISNIANRLFRRTAPLPTEQRERDCAANKTGAPACASPLAASKTSRAFCAIDCPGRCPLVLQLRDGELAGVRADKTAPACHRGLSMRAWANSPDRLMWPMRRVGPRGSAQFERVSWDEALDAIAGELARIRREYGNDAIYLAYSTGQSCTTADPFERLLNCFGGFLDRYNNYSNPQINAMVRSMYGESALFPGGSNLDAAADAQLVLAFGASPAETGTSRATWHGAWDRVVARIAKRGGRIVMVDPRRNGSIREAERAFDQLSITWLPINPGTDGALVAALLHELAFTHNALDWDFLRERCVGFTDDTLSQRWRGKGLSVIDYLQGTGYDHAVKTPAWAAQITGIPETAIRNLARELAHAKPAFIMQGWGPQRRSNGEMTSGMIMLLALALGQVGLPGTNSGMNVAWGGGFLTHVSAGHNNVLFRIPAYRFLDAIEDGSQLGAPEGVRGLGAKQHLPNSIKAIVCHGGNCLTNQHGDVNRAHRVLADTAKCEFIVNIDVEFTDSARYADIVLPDLFRMEQVSVMDADTWGRRIVASDGALGPRFERRSAWDACRDLAKRWGIESAFTEGLTEREWIRKLYEADRSRSSKTDEHIAPSGGSVHPASSAQRAAAGQTRNGCTGNPQCTSSTEATSIGNARSSRKSNAFDGLPPFKQLLEQGICFRENARQPFVSLADWRRDPVAHPLGTPSGKAEIFSEHLAAVAESLRGTPDENAITPIPTFVPEWDPAEFGVSGAGKPSETRKGTADEPKANSKESKHENATGSRSSLDDGLTPAQVREAMQHACDQPLRAFGFHSIARIHSSWGNVFAMPQRPRQVISINPADAHARGIRTGDLAEASNKFGTLRLPAEVTDNVIAGTIIMPQGAWWKGESSPNSTAKTPDCPARQDAANAKSDAGDSARADAQSSRSAENPCAIPDTHSSKIAGQLPTESCHGSTPIDIGGCINTLTSSRPSPLAFGNPQHTCWCRVRRAR